MFLTNPAADATSAVDLSMALSAITTPTMVVSEALILFVTSAAATDPSSAPDSAIYILSYDSSSGIEEKYKYWSDMILRDKYAKNLTENGWLVTCITCSQEKGKKRVIINMCRPYR